MVPIGCPETSVRNSHYSLHNDPEERSSQLLRGISLKSRNDKIVPLTNLNKYLYSGRGEIKVIINSSIERVFKKQRWDCAYSELKNRTLTSVVQ